MLSGKKVICIKYFGLKVMIYKRIHSLYENNFYDTKIYKPIIS